MAKRPSTDSPSTPKLEPKPEVQELRKLLLEAASEDFDELAELLAGNHRRHHLRPHGVHHPRHRSSRRSQSHRDRPSGAEKGGYIGSSMSCPSCQESARFHRWQDKGLVTLLGEVRVDRAYYYCKPCGRGYFPRDVALRVGPSDLTPGAAWAVATAGVLGSFAEAAEKTLPELCGLHQSESTVQRVTERIGAAVGAKLAAGETFGDAKDWAWSKDEDGKTLACVAADLTGVGMQGPGGTKADGRMAAVGMVWNPGRDGQVRYVCGMTGGLAALGDPLRRQAGQVGFDRAGSKGKPTALMASQL